MKPEQDRRIENPIVSFRAMRGDDWESVRSIYHEGISTGRATFESEVPSWVRWDETHLAKPRLVAVSSDSVIGWAALSPFSTRQVYKGVAEVSIYLASEWRGRGIGRALLEELSLKARNMASGP